MPLMTDGHRQRVNHPSVALVKWGLNCINAAVLAFQFRGAGADEFWKAVDDVAGVLDDEEVGEREGWRGAEERVGEGESG